MWRKWRAACVEGMIVPEARAASRDWRKPTSACAGLGPGGTTIVTNRAACSIVAMATVTAHRCVPARRGVTRREAVLLAGPRAGFQGLPYNRT